MLRLSLPKRAGTSGHRCHKGSGGGREKSHPEDPSKNPPQERAHHQKRILLSLRATELGTAASPCPRPHPREFQPLSCTWVDNHGTAAELESFLGERAPLNYRLLGSRIPTLQGFPSHLSGSCEKAKDPDNRVSLLVPRASSRQSGIFHNL